MKTIFEEKQRFTQWWLWVIIVLSAVVVISILGNALFQQIVLGKPWGDKPMSNELLLIMAMVNITAMFLMLMVFFNAMMEVVVDKNSIAYRFFPLIRKWRRIEREAIQSYEVREYYLRGYGIRRDLRGNRTINVKGNMGIEFIMTNGTKLLLGTQQPGEFLSALNKMKRSEEN